MKRVIYSATNPNGSTKNNFIEAKSNKEAINILRKKGLKNIRLHDDAFSSFQRDDLDEMTEKQLEEIAQFEINTRKKANVFTFLTEVLRVNKVLIITGLGIFSWGAFNSYLFTSIAGAVLGLSMPILSLWNYRVVNNFNKLQKTMARGEWEESLKLIDKLRKHMKEPEMAFNLDIYKASIIASKKSLTESLLIVKKWELQFEDVSPGLFESRVAILYHASGDYDGFLTKMREGFHKSSENPSILTDLALAEARFGSIEQAISLLEKVSIEELPQHGLPFIDWAWGIIAKRQNKPVAIDHLNKAILGLLAYSDNPAAWTSLALCTGSFAVLLSENGQPQKAKMLTQSVWDILKNHGDKPLLRELSNLQLNKKD